MLKLLGEQLKLLLEIFIISLFEPVVGNLFGVGLKDLVILDVQLVELSERVLRNLAAVHVDSLENSDLTLFLVDILFRIFAF